MNKNLRNLPIAEIIDNLAPINNKLRLEVNPIVKLELMWNFGMILDYFLNKYKLKLHELLYFLYDPHSTKKTSNITRDLGSYSYRVFKYFKKKEGIRNTLPELKSYALFREAFPLLSNPKYKKVNKSEIVLLLNSNLANKMAKEKFIDIKQKIRPIKNPRNQKAFQYVGETKIIHTLISNLQRLYKLHADIPDQLETENVIGDKKYRDVLSNIILILSNDTFIARLNKMRKEEVPFTLVSLYKIASGGNDDRSRFRKWVLSSNKLLSLAEGIRALDSKENYGFYRKKMLRANGENGG